MYRRLLLSVLLCGSLVLSLISCSSKEEDFSEEDAVVENTVTFSDSDFSDTSFTGSVTAIDEQTITMSVMVFSDNSSATFDSLTTDGEETSDTPDGEAPELPDGEAPDMTDGEAPDMTGSEAPDMPDGEAPDMTGSEAPDMPDGEAPNMQGGEAPDMTDGEAPDMTDGEAPNMQGGQGAMQMETVTAYLTIVDESVLFDSEGEAISLSDIEVGSYLTVELDSDMNIISVTISDMSVAMGDGMNMGGNMDMGGGGASGVESYDALQEFTEDAAVSEETYASTGTDENAIHIYEGATVTLNDVTVTRDSSDSTGGDNSSFYGVGAALLVSDGTAYINGGTFTTDAAGGAGIFSYGNGIVYVSNAVIKTLQDTSGGIHVAGAGTLYAWELDVETNGESSAAIRSDRGGGTMVVDGGTYTSNGTGSPAVYCTADITINNATLTANGSEAVCIEGLNTLRLFDCDLTGTMQENSQNDCTWNIIVYQSMSGDSEVGNGTFSMSGGSITANNGGMFYTTNTECTFYLSDVDIVYAGQNDFFLRCTGNANARGWGQTGSNGSQCNFTADNQAMEGDIIYDSISTLDFYMKNGSTLKGAFLDDESYAGNGGDGYCNVYISADSTWTVTGDSTITALYNEGTIVDENGSSVTIVGTDGTVYAEGSSQYTITVESYDTAADMSGSTNGESFADYAVEISQ